MVQRRAVVTVKVNTTAQPGAREPLNESLLGVLVEGAVELAKGFVHATWIMIAARSTDV